MYTYDAPIAEINGDAINASSSRERAFREDAHSNPNSAFNVAKKFAEDNQPEWTEIEGVKVLRIGESSVVAVPCTGRVNSRRFDIIDIAAGELLCQIERKEVWPWLIANAKAAQ